MKNKIIIFLHGTILMHKSGIGCSREKRVQQSKDREPSIFDYENYVPIGKAAEKVREWQNQGNVIIYLSSHENLKDVWKDKKVLEKFGFPQTEILFRQDGQSYKDIIEKAKPDVLIEDDCESMDKPELAISEVSPEIKRKIKSVIVKEFAGINDLPKSIGKGHL